MNGLIVALAIAYIDHLGRCTTPIEELVSFQQWVTVLQRKSEGLG